MKAEDSLRKNLRRLEIKRLDEFATHFQHIISTLYNQRKISDEDIESDLRHAVTLRAKKDFHWMMIRPQNYADHVLSPECLAYAISHGELTIGELEKIPFDHGETIKTYPSIYGIPNLIPYLRERLLNPIPPRHIPRHLPKQYP